MQDRIVRCVNNKLLAKKLGANVRKFREGLGLSQEELAERCGLHRTYVGSVERGERNVSLQNIVLLARAVNETPGTLLDGLK